MLLGLETGGVWVNHVTCSHVVLLLNLDYPGNAPVELQNIL